MEADLIVERYAKLSQSVRTIGKDIWNFQSAYSVLLEKLTDLQAEVGIQEGLPHTSDTQHVRPAQLALVSEESCGNGVKCNPGVGQLPIADASNLHYMPGKPTINLATEGLLPGSVAQSEDGDLALNASSSNAGADAPPRMSQLTTFTPAGPRMSQIARNGARLSQGFKLRQTRGSGSFAWGGAARPSVSAALEPQLGKDDAPSLQHLPPSSSKSFVLPVALKKRWDGAGGWNSNSISSQSRNLGDVAPKLSKTKKNPLQNHEHLNLDGRWVGLQALSSQVSKDEAKEEEKENAYPPEMNEAQPVDLQDQIAEKITSLYVVILPHSKWCICWDFFGLFLCFYDTITIPMMVAWNLATDGFFFGMFIISVVYWTCDILRAFCTGFYRNGDLVLSRLQIAKEYIRTWLIVDVCIVSIDFALLSQRQNSGVQSGSDLQLARGARTLRILRLVRLVRILKMGRHNQTIEDACGSTWMILFIALIKTFLLIFLSAHILSCMWYFIGQWSIENGKHSWVTDAAVSADNIADQYLHSFHWVLGQFTPAPTRTAPQNEYERSFNIVVIMFSLVVMGSSVSKVTATLQQLNANNSEKAKKRMKIRSYLSETAVPVELSSRIMRFVDHSLLNQNQSERKAFLDDAYISEALQKELTMFQRSGCLTEHPLLLLLSQDFESIFCELCGVTNMRVLGKEEVVFLTGSSAQGMVMTCRGSYCLSKLEQVEIAFADVRWFSEISLFCSVTHNSTLTAQTFGEVFELSGSDLVQCVRNYPSSSVMICDYAQAILSMLDWNVQKVDDYIPPDFSHSAIEKTAFYRKKNRINWEVEDLDLADITMYTNSKYADEAQVREFLQKALDGTISDQEIMEELPEVFPELHQDLGAYAQLNQHQERRCAIASIMSVIWLLRNHYDNFVAPQDKLSRMSVGLWADLQNLFVWSEMGMDTIHAMFVYLSIRGLGKAKQVVKRMPRDRQGPEYSVLHLMKEQQNIVPSVALCPGMVEVIATNLRIHAQFNLGQMMQGENTPSNVRDLQDYITKNGTEALKFYLFSIVGIMCGLGSDETSMVGSRFMNEKQGHTTIICCYALQHLGSISPQEIYWNYILLRATLLKLPVLDSHELALVRLACLNRTMEASEVKLVADAWHAISSGDRSVLTEHLLKDGILEKAVLFSFLPLCFANARENTVVGLQTVLVLLAEVILLVDSPGVVSHAPNAHTLVTVDLSDLALFLSSVKGSSVLFTCIADAELRQVGDTIRLMMTSKNWSHVHDGHNQDLNVSHGLKRILRNQQSMEAALCKLGVHIKDLDAHGNSSNAEGQKEPLLQIEQA